MATPETTPTVAHYDSGEWEIVHDNGFVYKRKKRRLDPTALVRAPDPAPDPAVELKERRKRKRKALLQLKTKYQKEIGLWEHLSNTLNAMEARNPTDWAEKEREKKQEISVHGSDSAVSQSGSLLSEVFLQVEAQEAIIRDFSQLCDVAEALCSAHEEKTKQLFLDLPIWKSPLELMSSLCED